MTDPDDALTPEPQMLPYDPNDPIACLRADLDAARAEIRRLRMDLDAIVERHASDMGHVGERITRRKTEIVKATRTAMDALTVATNAIEIVKRKV
jgi:hypothetical protein